MTAAQAHFGLLIGSSAGPVTAYPSLLEILTQAFNSDTTSHNVAMPATVSTGELLIVEFATDGSSTGSAVTTPSGWTQLNTSFYSAASCRHTVFYKVAAGTEGGTTVDFVTTNAEEAVAHLRRYQAGTYNGAPQMAYGTQASTTTPQPPALSPSWGSTKTAWIIGTMTHIVRTPSAYPYATNQRHTSSPLVALTTCTTEAETGTLSPGTFTMNSSAQFNIPYTIAVRPA